MGAPPETRRFTRPPKRSRIFAKTMTVGQDVRERKREGQGASRLPEVRGAAADLHRPGEDTPPQGRALVDPFHDPGVDLLEDPRDSDLDRGPQLAEVVDQFVDALGVDPADPRVQGRVDGHPLEHVRERQVGDAEILRVEILRRHGVDRREVEIGVGDHRPLRRTGGAGGVGDRGEIGGLDRAPDGVEAPRLPQVQLVPLPLEIREGDDGGGETRPRRFEDDQPLGEAHGFADREDLIEDGVVFDEDQAATAVADDVLLLPGAGRRIDPDHDRAGGEGGEVRVGPFGPGPADDPDPVPFADTGGDEPHRRAAEVFPGLAPGRRGPAAVVLAQLEDAVAEAPGLVHEHPRYGRGIVELMR